MGQGTSAPPTTAAPVAPTAPATPNSSTGLSDKQKMAISQLLGQIGKSASSVPSMHQPQMSVQPITQTVQGGTFINPQQR